jgi:hypothetical protein
VYCVLCTVYCVLCTVYCVLCTVYCVLCTVYWGLCTLYCVLRTVSCVLRAASLCCVLCIVCCVLRSACCALYAACCVFVLSGLATQQLSMRGEGVDLVAGQLLIDGDRYTKSQIKQVSGYVLQVWTGYFHCCLSVCLSNSV